MLSSRGLVEKRSSSFVVHVARGTVAMSDAMSVRKVLESADMLSPGM